MLTGTLNPKAFHLDICAKAALMTHSPKEIAKGWSSMIGKKEEGDKRPLVGCSQRISASTPIILPVLMLTLG